ncbi:MAG TPA: 4Fe-4S dicluster domain-containing protein [Chromatiales bacterium]|nr:4Fe-4S dicluster domain-containing protein [Thiotrichales bacterium]HIP68466.1 4Fe-4S dicluster domain-containing protein [Chromatiales bacterium]
MATSKDEMKHTFRKFEDGDNKWGNWQEAIFNEDHSHKCPTYVHRTPPCQGSCPSGEDIRGWLQVVRGIEKPTGEMDWQEYAFRRLTDANPFPAMMGRVCPAPCEDGCNRNEVDDFVGINAVEQFIGDTARENNLKFEAGAPLTGKKIAIIGGGPAGLAAAYQLRRIGHASTVFDDHAELGGMFRYGIPGYRVPRDYLAAEIQRIVDMGDIEIRLNTRVGKDISVEDLEKDYDAILWAIGCKNGRALPVPGSEAKNCVTGVQFLEAFNKGDMQVTAKRVVCVGGGDTSIDVVSVARRLGAIKNPHPKDSKEHAEGVVLGYVTHDAVEIAQKEGADVTLTSLFPKANMTAAEHEIMDALEEGVTILDGYMPVEVIMGDDGRATGLKVAQCKIEGDSPVFPLEVIEGTEQIIECDLIVSAIGQTGDLEGVEEYGNDKGLIDSDQFYQVPGKEGHFVAGDIVRPHLLTTAIGQASIAAESIDHYLKHEKQKKRPKVDKHQFDLLQKLNEAGLTPASYDHRGEIRGTNDADFAVHNYEDRAKHEVIASTEMFLGHFEYEPRHKRAEQVPSAEQVIGHFEERIIPLPEEEAKAEADRCMSCGMCFECDNCVIYCPQDAVYRVPKDQSTTGRYVATDYSRCVGCHICADVCPTGYIDMALGE